MNATVKLYNFALTKGCKRVFKFHVNVTVLQQLRGKYFDVKAEMDEIRYEREVEKRRGVNGFVDTICCRAPGWKRPVYLALLLQLSQQLAVIVAVGRPFPYDFRCAYII